MKEFFSRYPIAVRLPKSFEIGLPREEVNKLPETWWQQHQGPYHNGGWETISLWAPGGDRGNQRSFGASFAATEALSASPNLKKIIDSLPGEKNRIRLMRLRPGGVIERHSDPMKDINPSLVRLHMPIDTNPKVDFRVAGRKIIMLPGEVWLIDVRFPHEVRNEGDTMRVHLVADLLRS